VKRAVETGPSLRELLEFLRDRPLAWLLPIVLFLGALVWLAMGVLRTPESPFMYRSY
jgi:hypothetical protein